MFTYQQVIHSFASLCIFYMPGITEEGDTDPGHGHKPQQARCPAGKVREAEGRGGSGPQPIGKMSHEQGWACWGLGHTWERGEWMWPQPRSRVGAGGVWDLWSPALGLQGGEGLRAVP